MTGTAWQQVADMLAGAERLVLEALILNHKLEVKRANKIQSL